MISLLLIYLMVCFVAGLTNEARKSVAMINRRRETIKRRQSKLLPFEQTIPEQECIEITPQDDFDA